MKWQSITSPNNPRGRQLLRFFEKPRERREAGLVIVEGLREIRMAIKAHYIPRELYLAEGLGSGHEISDIIEYFENTPLFILSQEAFARIAYRENRDGAVALFSAGLHPLDSLHLSDNPLLLIAEAVEKPGNLGALLRTADAAAVDALILCDPRTDVYNPNVVRASIGTLFNVQVGVAETPEVLTWLQANKIRPFAAALTPSAFPYTRADFTLPSAIVVGTEADGLSSLWLRACPNHIIIPMYGLADSLNVSVSAAIIIFEALRQRNAQSNLGK